MSKENRPDSSASSAAPAVVIVMGVSGCGKSTIGALLASHLRWEFEDADWFHSTANIDKMHSGIPLNDEVRRPWLQSIAVWLDQLAIVTRVTFDLRLRNGGHANGIYCQRRWSRWRRETLF